MGAAGLAVSDMFDIRLADPDTDEEVPVGQVGELQIRAKEPWIINSGYYGMPEATANARRNLWFHTGDRGVIDSDGYVWYTDRIKDAIRRRDWLALTKEHGGNIYYIYKLGAATGFGLYHMGAQMRGETYEQFLATRGAKGAR